MSTSKYQLLHDESPKDDGRQIFADEQLDAPRSRQSCFRTIVLAIIMFLSGVITTFTVMELRPHSNTSECRGAFAEEKLCKSAEIKMSLTKLTPEALFSTTRGSSV